MDRTADSAYLGESQPLPSNPARPPPQEQDESHVIGSDGVPRLKRTACILCRKRKLRCDQLRPKCGTCDRLGHECQYDEGGRKKSGPKRGYVKALEARLAQVETLLRTQDASDPTGVRREAYDDIGTLGMGDPLQGPELENFPANVLQNPLRAGRPSFTQTRPNLDRSDTASQAGPSPTPNTQPALAPATSSASTAAAAAAAAATASQDFDSAVDMTGEFSFDMIALGLEEPLPTQEIMTELNALFFEKAHLVLPMIHKARFYAALDLAPNMRPPVCLRYAMWAIAAQSSDRYEGLAAHFYERSRKYLDRDEMRGFGQAILTLSHCQTWILITGYEFKNMFFPRAWMSTGRATRLAQMLGLHRVDGMGLDVKQTLPVPNDWAEQEERRRTFWMAFWCDRCASIGTGWPMSLEEKDILTDLPASEANFQSCKPEKSERLQTALQNGGKDLNSIAGATLMATLFGRNLMHLHRPEPDDNEDDLNGKFWQRHRYIDNTLLNITLSLPDMLKLPAGMGDPNVVFLNMCLHSSTICLHQAAIFKADKNKLPGGVASESKMRCIGAATEIASIMRAVCHVEVLTMNPFIPFCLYVAGRVFVQYLKARPGDQRTLSNLTFLLQATNAMTRRAAIAESFIAQLELDMDVAGVPNPLDPGAYPSGILNDAATQPAGPGQHFYQRDGHTRLDLHRSPYETTTNSAASQSTRPGSAYPPTETGSSSLRQQIAPQRPMGKSRPLNEVPRGPQIVEMDTSPETSGMAGTESRTLSGGPSRNGSIATGNTPSNRSDMASPPVFRKDGQSTPANPQFSSFANTMYYQQQQNHQAQLQAHGHMHVPAQSQGNFFSTDYSMFADLSSLPAGMEATGATPNTEAWNEIMSGMNHDDWSAGIQDMNHQ